MFRPPNLAGLDSCYPPKFNVARLYVALQRESYFVDYTADILNNPLENIDDDWTCKIFLSQTLLRSSVTSRRDDIWFGWLPNEGSGSMNGNDWRLFWSLRAVANMTRSSVRNRGKFKVVYAVYLLLGRQGKQKLLRNIMTSELHSTLWKNLHVVTSLSMVLPGTLISHSWRWATEDVEGTLD